MKKEKFITIGEIMLRLTPPDYEKIRTTNMFEARYGGSEANVALSLANLGIDASFFTVVPDNSLGKSAIRMLRSNDVDCSSVKFTTEEETPTHRLGTYYLETGYGIRPSKVIYDRKNSAFAEYDFAQTDLDAILEGHTWLHLSGITPALGKSCKEMILACLKLAKEKGMTVSFDGNFRSTLWDWEEARDFCTMCLPYRCFIWNRAISFMERRAGSSGRRCQRRSAIPARFQTARRGISGVCKTLSKYQMHCKACQICT